jgi:mannose-6-phosphate isomerase-like protein (cupin superfamily)
LHQLAAALGTSITDFFQEEESRSVVHVQRDGRLEYRRGGISMKSLGAGLHDQRLEPFLITVESGMTSEDLVEHPGQEFVYCLEGTIDYEVDGKSYALHPGDSLLLDATRPHLFRNSQSNASTLLVVFQASDHLSLARERHLGGK